MVVAHACAAMDNLMPKRGSAEHDDPKVVLVEFKNRIVPAVRLDPGDVVCVGDLVTTRGHEHLPMNAAGRFAGYLASAMNDLTFFRRVALAHPRGDDGSSDRP